MIWPRLERGHDRPGKAQGSLSPSRVVEEVRGGERHVHVARLLDRLAAVHRSTIASSRLLLDQPRDA